MLLTAGELLPVHAWCGVPDDLGGEIEEPVPGQACEGGLPAKSYPLKVQRMQSYEEVKSSGYCSSLAYISQSPPGVLEFA